MDVLHIDGIEVFHSVFEYLDSNMYLLFPNNGEAVIIDPHVRLEFLSLLQEKNISKVHIFLTHEHTDHTSGIYWYQDRFDCDIVCQSHCAKYISETKKRLPLLISFVLEERDRLYGTHRFEDFKREYVPRTYTTDMIFEDSLDVMIGSFKIHLEHIPGHSNGSSLVIVNENIVFTGDSLMKDDPVITRFPGSNHHLYIEKTLPRLSALNPETYIFPGHGDVFQLKDVMVDGKLNISYR